jgi:hypothetical protein
MPALTEQILKALRPDHGVRRTLRCTCAAQWNTRQPSVLLGLSAGRPSRVIHGNWTLGSHLQSPNLDFTGTPQAGFCWIRCSGSRGGGGTNAHALIYAGYRDDLAAVYVASAALWIMWVLHAIEVKLNRLLDYHGVHVTDAEIAKD